MILSRDQKKFDVLVDLLGINLLTGMKGSGKSYLAKPLLLKLIVEESKLSKKIFPDGISLKKLKIDYKPSELS